MQIIIVGAGEVGSHLCETLSRSGHSVTVIENREAVADRLDEEFDARVVRANGSSAQVLMRAGIEKCDYFLAMTSNDETNLVASSLAKALGARNTFTRIHDQTFRDTTAINYQAHFGIDHLVNPERLAALEIAKAIRNPGRVAVEDFGRGQIEVQVVTVHEGARVAGRPLMEAGLGGRLRVGLVQRDDALQIPSARTELRAGDLVTLFGPPELLYESRSLFDPQSRSATTRKIVLLGGGEISISLVRLLSSNRFHVRIIEKDANVTQQLSEQFPGVTIIHGDGTSLRVLEEEQVGSADYFVAGTKDDEDNVMTCLQASKLGCRHVMLAINRPDYVEVLTRLKDTLGVELAVSPRVATANEVLRNISKKPYVVLSRLPDDAALIVETRVSPGSQVEGRRIREVKWPEDTLVVAHVHQFEARMPAADDIIYAGDRLVTIIRPEIVDQLIGLME